MTIRIAFSVFLVGACANSVFGQAPKVTGFAPANGPVNTPVVVTGTGFSTTAADNIVQFGAVRGTVTAASATQLTVTAPAGASFEPLSVTVNGRIASASKPFVITYPGSVPLSQDSFKPYLIFDYTLESFAVNDIDRDGKADLVFSDWNDGTISAVKNNAAPAKFNRSAFDIPVDVTSDAPVGKVLMADFDGDGVKDLLQTANPDAALQVYRNLDTQGTISASSFGPVISVSLVLPSYDFSFADFDQDGRIDIVAISTDISQYYLTILQNTSTPGTISFAPHMDILLTTSIYNLATGDLDGNGMPDILAGNETRLLSVFENKMTGPGTITASSFGTPFNLFSNDYPTSVAVCDIDQDGKNDIAISSQTLVLHHNVGTPGTLTAASFETPVNLNVSGDISFGDLNGDGKPDLALGYSGFYDYINVLTNTSTTGSITEGSFSEPLRLVVGSSYYGLEPSEVRIQDLDNDGKSEIIVVNSRVPNLSVLRNTSGTPPAVPTITSLTPGSGAPETTVTIAGTNFSATAAENIVFFGATAATVTAATATSLSVTIPFGATTDYVTVTTGSRTAFSPIQFVPLQTGTPGETISFDEPINIASEATLNNITIKDMDKDGRADIIGSTYLNGSPGIHLFKNSGNASVAFDAAYTTYSSGVTYGILDADGDGIPDLVGASEDGGDGSLMIVSFGTGNITSYGIDPLLLQGAIPEPGNFAIADLDRDGQPDFGAAESNGGVYIPRNTNGGFVYDYAQYFTLDPVSNFLAFADIDSDGKPDAILSQPEGETISILQNTSVPGTISFSNPVAFATDGKPRMVAAGDLDGDGKADIIVVNESSVSILRNTTQGPGTISPSALAGHFELDAVSPAWVAAGDLNGDGKLDLGLANGDNTISIFRNISSSGSLSPNSFAGKVLVATGNNPSGLAFGDLNNDGATDMAVTFAGENFVSVYTNTPGNTAEAKLIVFNGVSPDGDGKNDHWHIQNINVLPDTRTNHVSLYNRWGDKVYEIDNYDNSSAVFTGKNNDGKELPNGTYYYKISFTGGRKTESGFLSLKK